LITQWVWYAENAGIETADRFLAAADATSAMLAHQPGIGVRAFVTRPELQGMRQFPISDGFDRTLIFYFPLKDGIDLVRVVHASRDLHRLLSEGFFGWAVIDDQGNARAPPPELSIRLLQHEAPHQHSNLTSDILVVAQRMRGAFLISPEA
jgi:toxin ParE1/3/4